MLYAAWTFFDFFHARSLLGFVLFFPNSLLFHTVNQFLKVV